MSKKTILVIEDDEILSGFLCEILNTFHYSTLIAKNGKQALNIIPFKKPDLILLDLGLPDMDGTDVIRQVREWSSIPIIVVSARDGGNQKAAALDLGADDYVTKPFNTQEFLARIRTALRHNKNASATGNDNSSVQMPYRSGKLVINYDRRLVTIGEDVIHLTQNEYKIVTLLSTNAGKVLTYNFIISNIWGVIYENDNKIIRVNMANIRRKLERGPDSTKYILTETGIGYRMLENDNLQ